MPPSTLLDRILWTQLARVVNGAAPEWEPQSASARAIRAALEAAELDPEESAIVERWDEQREGSRVLFDRLLQARVNRAVREGLRVEAERHGLAELPRVPRVLVVRDGAPEDERAATVSPRRAAGEGGASAPRPRKTDVANLAPGAKLEELVDLLVLANQGAADELRSSMGANASVVRAEDGPEIDLLLDGPTPSIQVFDIERELARLEEVLRRAIPPGKRPARSGSWSFGQDLTGALLGGKYRIKALKGKGAFKTVYEGEDEMLGARVAVAVLNPKGARSPRALEHFQDEARQLTTLDHENIVRWITFDRAGDGLHYFVMEYLDGEELESLLRREGRLAPRRVARILLQVVAALKRAHKGGKQGALLHLDLKPENVFVLQPLAPGEPERVKVIDFGIGQHVGAEVRAAERPELRTLYDLPAEDLGKSVGSLALPDVDEPEPPEKPQAAASGGRVRVQRARGGTLLYASPEQCKHLAGHRDIQALDGRSDLYSLGVMAFRMLTGQFPFARNGSAMEAIQNHLETAPRRVGSLGIKIPRELAAFVDRCLVKDREKRWRDASEAHEALERIVQPRLSPVKVVVPVAGLAAAGLAALYFTRDPVVNLLTLVDPAIGSVSGRVLKELHLGPKAPVKIARLESDSAWDDGAPLRLVDYASGAALAGWRVRWSESEPNAIEIACQAGARSAAVLLEIDGGRRARWRSERLTLNHLGPWSIERVAVEGHDSARLLDPRGRVLELEVGGDPEGRAALESIEVLFDGKSIGIGHPPAARARAELAVYAGPELDELFTGTPREVELQVVARDRAGQEERARAALQLAGLPVAFTPETGFVVRADPEAALLYPGTTQVLLPEHALRVAVTSSARTRIHLDQPTAPVVVREIGSGSEPIVVALSELGIAGERDLRGTLRIDLDDSPWVDRAAELARKDSRSLSFLFMPRSPEIQAELSGQGLARRPLLEQVAADLLNAANAAPAAELHVSGPPGVPLWIEAAYAREEAELAAPVPMSRTSSGSFDLPLELAQEGRYRIVLRKYSLQAGDERGPLIPPEHLFRLEVDRTAPALTFEVQGGESGDGGTRLFRDVSRQRIGVRVAEGEELDELAWSLLLPDGTRRSGRVEPGASAELRDLAAHQLADGRYELECTARDRAGNASTARESWQVARTGPDLSLQAPAAGADRGWLLADGRRYNVQVRASDPNGVAAVLARVVYQSQPGPELALQRTSGDLWELAEAERPSANPWWTGKELVLELVARDGAGLETKKTERGIVPELRREGELVIAPRERPGETMVEVAVTGSYSFGGRRNESRRAWNVTVEGLRPFYLDAREVTRAELLEFVHAAGGYADARWWPAGSGPDASRAAQLARALGGDPARPATGVSWPEAWAYAAWRGKRLPTLVEWEFAVRGAEYRAAPAARTPPGAPPEWPANLCASPGEWTATPERLTAEALDFATQCKRYPERLLAPRPDRDGASAPLAAAAAAGSHWVAGAPVAAEAPWAARTLCPDSPGEAEVGFRCALERETAHARLDRGEYEIVE